MLLLLALSCGSKDEDSAEACVPAPVVSPSPIALGEVPIGGSTRVTATITNDACADLSFSGASLSVSGPIEFDLVSYPQTLEKGASGDIVIAYSPGAEGEDTVTLTLPTDHPELPEVTAEVTGAGVRPVITFDPPVLDFGTMPFGASTSLTATVTAGGSGDLVINGVSLEPADHPYTWEFDPAIAAFPYTLPNGTSLAVEVTFTPSEIGTYFGALVFVSNDPADPISNLSLQAIASD